MKISFQTSTCCFEAELQKHLLAQSIFKRLPLDSTTVIWGDEIYFKTKLDVPVVGQSTTDLRVGDIVFWPEGKCICIFFGPTPMSDSEKPVPASPVIIIGKTVHSPEELRKIKAEEPIHLMAVKEKEPRHINPNDFPKDRKLTQNEIDLLVQQLLEQEKNKE
ncbi:MAG: hypothetical protein GY853_14860 [PVC group bacterium]|nr:hypothetical protein [PVC group bacterium]